MGLKICFFLKLHQIKALIATIETMIWLQCFHLNLTASSDRGVTWRLTGGKQLRIWEEICNIFYELAQMHWTCELALMALKMSVQILKTWGDGFERTIRQSGNIDYLVTKAIWFMMSKFTCLFCWILQYILCNFMKLPSWRHFPRPFWSV